MAPLHIEQIWLNCGRLPRHNSTGSIFFAWEWDNLALFRNEFKSSLRLPHASKARFFTCRKRVNVKADNFGKFFNHETTPRLHRL
jgi:hypothetical protein